MDAAQAQERRMVREAAIGLTAIVLAVGCLCAVVAWKFELFSAVSNTPPPPDIQALSDLPEYVAMQRAKAEREQAAEEEQLRRRRASRPVSPTVVHAADEPAWQPRNSMVVDYQAPVEPPSTAGWTPPEVPEMPVESNVVAESSATVGAAMEPNSFEPAASEFDASELHPPPPRDSSLGTERITVDAPPAFRETTRPAGQQVPTAAQRMVAPFAEDDAPPAVREMDELDRAMILAAASSVAPVNEESLPDFVVVAPGDSFFRIAERVYGDGEFYKALYEHNRDRFPRAGNLPVGASVATPPAAELQRLYPELAPPK